jgi:hypothetical protein
MAGRRLASTQDGPAKKKKKVKDPCHYCPAGDKRRSSHGEVDEKTKVWKYKCCREHFEGLKAEGKDVSKLVSRSTASALKNGATSWPTLPRTKYLPLPLTPATPAAGCTSHARCWVKFA